ncbi:MAG TPA: asparagine synthase-related protein [Candidatus Acidoferrales bacterium]|nr:asparagine synthase-related protein [Candidatus Acidoferrales bacterium]
MANFIVVIDPDAERRFRFAETVKPRLAFLPGLKAASCSTGDFFAAWAASEKAPVDTAVTDAGAAIIWGRALRPGSSEKAAAAELGEAWDIPPERVPEVFDGYYAAAVYRQAGGALIGADPLGLFPVYHYACGEVLLVGSSPELFRFHPSFRSEFNPAGLVGILLLMHAVDGETLLRGVKRLKAGHCLYWDSRQKIKEARQYSMPVSLRHFDLPFSSQVRLLDESLEQAVLRQTDQREAHLLLLSGGLDSRILAGYLRDHGVATVALSLGQRGDSEIECAARVAACLGFEHEIREVDEDQYPRFAQLQALWEHGTTGFSTIMEWGIHALFRSSASYVVGGHLMDTITGPRLEYKQFAGPPTFGRFFRFINSYGVRAERLRKLLRPDIFGDAVDACIGRIREIYRGYSDLEWQRSWCFKINHRARFHVGGVLWRHSFGAWPILPAADQAVLACAGGMPAATLAEGLAEKRLLETRFPDLAEIPLDNFHNEPLKPRLRWLLNRHVQWTLRRWIKFGADGKNRSRGRINRLYDINGPGWVSVRREAEPFRKHAYEFFQKKELDALLPAPGTPIAYEHPVIDVSGIKSVLGFLLWLKDHPC